MIIVCYLYYFLKRHKIKYILNYIYIQDPLVGGSMNVLVVGATGFMGRAAVRQLLDAGMRVRAMTRTPEKAADLQKMGAEIVQGDLIDPPSLARACKGMYAVISAAHGLLGEGKYNSAAVDFTGQRDLIDAAKAAGVEHFVFTS